MRLNEILGSPPIHAHNDDEILICTMEGSWVVLTYSFWGDPDDDSDQPDLSCWREGERAIDGYDAVAYYRLPANNRI